MAAVVGVQPLLGEASLRPGRMMALKRLHVLVLLTALAGAVELAVRPRRGEPGRGRTSRRSLGVPLVRLPGAADPSACLFVCVGPPTPPAADLHGAARWVLIERLPRVLRWSGRGEEAPIKTKISCFNGLLN